MPGSLYLFFEAENIRNISPSFLRNVALVVTEGNDIAWQDIYLREINIFYKKHNEFF